ncbi:MAG: 30S ribosomal protein S6, partial [Chloroflexi bacterium]|nr:30S ribosomal protein S6 [Chloroflexota bacterium]
MNEYELMYVISPRLMVEEAESAIERVNGLIQDAGGEVLLTDNWGRRRLAYPIKHHFEGTYVLTHMTLPSDRVAGFERALHLNEGILRHLVVRGIVPGYEGPPEEELVYARRSSTRPAPPRAAAAAADEAAPAAEADEAAPVPAADDAAPAGGPAEAEAPAAAEEAEAPAAAE